MVDSHDCVRRSMRLVGVMIGAIRRRACVRVKTIRKSGRRFLKIRASQDQSELLRDRSNSRTCRYFRVEGE